MIASLLLAALSLPAMGGSTLRYAEDRAPATPNPLFATTMSEARLNELVFEGLYTDDRELRSKPNLAASSVVATDRMSMTLTLKQGVTWHDGHPFNAEDVIFTIHAMKSTETASPEAGRVSWIETVRGVDDHNLEITFKSPEYAPADKLHFKILPAHLFDSTDVRRSHPFRNQPIGTGPWKFHGFNDDNSVTLLRHEAYHGTANLSEVVMREVSDKNYQAKLLIYESLEALVRVLPRDIATLDNDRKVELYPYQTNSWWYVGFNQRRTKLQDKRLREAITMMVDVPELLRPIGTGERISGPFVPSSPFYDHQTTLRQYDPDKAAGLLREAGYTFNGRSWLGSDGTALKLSLATQNNLETAQDVVINLQSQLQSRGIAVEPEFLGIAEWKQRVWRDHDFDMVLSQWSFDRNEDVFEQFHSTGARNFVGYNNDEVDKLLAAAHGAADPFEKKSALRKTHTLIAADMPMVFLWTLDSYSAVSVKVTDVVVHPFYFFTWAGDWRAP
jgi:peptide/nickel transport system substrate-binding protein